MHILDKGGDWYVNTSAYRMAHPTRRDEGGNPLVFESGIKYKVNEDAWIKDQPTMKKTDMDEELAGLVQVAPQPKSPRVNAGTK
jgi:hypothetical protein